MVNGRVVGDEEPLLRELMKRSGLDLNEDLRRDASHLRPPRRLHESVDGPEVGVRSIAHLTQKIVQPDQGLDGAVRDCDLGYPRHEDGIGIVELERQLVDTRDGPEADQVRDLRIGAGRQATDGVQQAVEECGIR